MSVMVVVTVLNLVLAINLVVADGSGPAQVINSQNIFVLAGMQMVLVLVAYVACKYRPIPVRS